MQTIEVYFEADQTKVLDPKDQSEKSKKKIPILQTIIGTVLYLQDKVHSFITNNQLLKTATADISLASKQIQRFVANQKERKLTNNGKTTSK